MISVIIYGFAQGCDCYISFHQGYGNLWLLISSMTYYIIMYAEAFI